MKLISETIEEPVKFLTEEKDGKKTFYIEGIAAQGGIVNRNRRLYPPEILEREISKHIEEKIKTGKSLGELEHPASPKLNLDRVSHIFREVKHAGNDWYAKAALTETPCGKIAEGLLQAGATIGYSTRGLGSLKIDEKNNWSVVQGDFKLAVLADLVADPSAPNAFVKGVMEGIEFTQTEDGSWIAEHLESTKKTFKSMHVEQLKNVDEASKHFNRFFELMTTIQEEDGSMITSLAVQANVEPKRAKEAWYNARLIASRQNMKEDYKYIESLARQFLGL